MGSLAILLIQLLQVVKLLVLVYVIVSWVTVFGHVRWRYHPAVRFLERVVEPMLAPIRNLLRPYTRNVPIDFSPIILFFLIDLVQQVLSSLAVRAVYLP